MKQRLCLLVFLGLASLSPGQDKPAKTDRPKTVAAPAAKPTVTAVAPSSVAELAPGPETPRPAAPGADLPAQVASIFFGLLQKNLLDPAYEGLTKGSKIGERPEEVKTLKAKTKEAIDVFGPVTGYELVETKYVGTHLLRRTYLSLNKEFPLRWRFYFYNSDSLWRLVDLRVDDRVTGMFDEAEEAKSAPEEK